jgi:hypothetical protein
MDLLTHQGTSVPTEGATITIRIARSSGKVFRLDFLFGLEVRQRFNLFEFDRVSLSHAVFVPDTRFPWSVRTWN